MDKDDRLVAQFPVTMGSSKEPLPLGNWKATTYAFLPPFPLSATLWDVAELQGGAEGPTGTQRPGWCRQPLNLTKDVATSWDTEPVNK